MELNSLFHLFHLRDLEEHISIEAIKEIMEKQQEKKANPKRDALIRALVAFGSVTAFEYFKKTSLAPFSRVKVLLATDYEIVRQGRMEVPYKGIVDCFSRVIQTEGLLSLWKGNMIQIFPTIVGPAATFVLKDKFRKLFNPNMKADGYFLWFVKNILSGAAAGATSLLYMYPFNLGYDIRCADVTGQQGGVISIWKNIVKTDGFFGLYRGFGLAMLGIIIYRGIYFGLYDALRPLFKPRDSPVRTGLLGWFVTLTALAAVHPISLMQKRLMLTTGGGIKYNSVLDMAKQILQKEGLRGFYRGIAFSMLYSIVGAAMLVGYDYLKARSKAKADAQKKH